jgi:hypothetical protein
VKVVDRFNMPKVTPDQGFHEIEMAERQCRWNVDVERDNVLHVWIVLQKRDAGPGGRKDDVVLVLRRERRQERCGVQDIAEVPQQSQNDIMTGKESRLIGGQDARPVRPFLCGSHRREGSCHHAFCPIGSASIFCKATTVPA